MKGLVLLNRVPYPTKDGGAIATLQMLKGLHNQGIELTILSLNTNKHFISPQSIPNEIISLGKWHFVDINTDIKIWKAFKNLFGTKSYNVERFYNPIFSQKLIELLKSNSFDFIQLEGLHIGVYLPDIQKASTIPVFLRAHNVEWIIWERLALECKNPIKKFYLNLLSKRIKFFEIQLITLIQGIICISKIDEEIFNKSIHQINTIYIPTGLYTRDYPYYTPENGEPNSIYHLGSLDWAPNIEGVKWFINEVFPLIIKVNGDVKLYLAGRKIDDSIKKLSSTNIIILENIEDAKQFSIQKKILIVPLHSGSGMRIKILEALMMGKPIISTSIGVEGIDAQNGKEILIEDNPKQFAMKVLELLSHPIEEKKLSENAREFAIDHFSQEQWDKKLFSYYQKMI